MSQESYAQSKFEIKGVVIDTNNLPLSGATVILLNAADSVLAGFSLSNNEGLFQLKNNTPGDYILQVTYVGYADHSEPITLARNPFDRGAIQLEAQSALLDEVVVKAEHVPIRIKNDTIEYNSAAYQTQPHAVVEDLLKKLPGVEVRRDGSIRAQGEQVDNILVDGKPFFGDDPQIATKNLPADAVDKVQVFDKKSEMAEFTGIDDGREQKTINLSLKEDKKSGYFGRLEGGFGTDDRFEGKANINRFSSKSQLSFIGLANNTNQEGFSIEDYINFMGGIQNLMSGGGGSMRLTLNSNELGLPMNLDPNNGLRQTLAGGLNFNTEFSKSTQLESSYFYNQIKNDINQSSFRQNVLNERSFNSSEESLQNTQNAGHRLNARIEHRFDSVQNIIFKNSLGYSGGELDDLLNNKTFNTAGQLENTGTRENKYKSSYLDFRSSLMYRRRFQQKGRALVGEVSFEKKVQDQDAAIRSKNFFKLDEPSLTFADSLQQIQDQKSEPEAIEFRLSYTEPLGKRRYMEFSYVQRNFANENRKNFFDLLPLTGEQQFNPLLSNQYQMDYNYNLGGVRFRLNRKKYQFTLGTKVQRSALKGNIISENVALERDFVFLLPDLTWNYDFSSTKNLSLNYSTNVQEPTIEQLQPVVDNSNPLNVYEGNLNLRPEYTHRLSLNVMSFDQFSSISIMGFFDAVYTKDKITNSTSIDSLFRQVVRPVNVKSNFNLYSNLSFNAPIKSLKSTLNFRVNSNFNRGILLINQKENTSKRWMNTFELSIQNNKTEKLDVYVGARFDFTRTRYSLDTQMDQQFLNQTYFADLTLNFAKHWSINSTINYTQYSNEAFAGSRGIPIWSAAISRNILKEKGQLKLYIYDILNRNIGIRRNNEFNYIEEVNTNTLRQYVMLKMIYSLSGLKAGAGAGGGFHFRSR